MGLDAYCVLLLVVAILLQQGRSRPQKGNVSAQLVSNEERMGNERVRAIRTALSQQQKMLQLQLQQYKTLKKIRGVDEDETSFVPVTYAFKRSNCHLFANKWNGASMHDARDLLRALNRTLANHHIDYSISGVTALGYARETTFVPWNTSMVAVVARDHLVASRESFAEPFCTCSTEREQGSGSWKLFRCDSISPGAHCGSPSIDVSGVGSRNETAMIPSLIPTGDGKVPLNHSVLEALLLPSKHVIFAGVALRGPQNLPGYLKMRFGDYEQCHSPKGPKGHYVSRPCEAVMTTCRKNYQHAWLKSSSKRRIQA